MKKNVDKNRKELSESEIFEKIKEEIAPLKKNLSEKSLTVNEAKSELTRINEWIKGTNLEKEKQQKLSNAFNKLNEELQETTSENESLITGIESLINKVDEIKEGREAETKSSISSFKEENKNLAEEIIQSKDYDPDAKKGRIESDKKIKDQFARAAETETGLPKRLAEAISYLLNS